MENSNNTRVIKLLKNGRFDKNCQEDWDLKSLSDFKTMNGMTKTVKIKDDMFFKCFFDGAKFVMSVYHDGWFRIDNVSRFEKDRDNAYYTVGVLKDIDNHQENTNSLYFKTTYLHLPYNNPDRQTFFSQESKFTLEKDNSAAMFNEMRFLHRELPSFPLIKTPSMSYEITAIDIITYKHVCELFSKTVPSGYQAHFSYDYSKEKNDKYFCYGKVEIFFYESGIFDEVYYWANDDWGYDNRYYGTYVKNENGFDLTYFSLSKDNYRFVSMIPNKKTIRLLDNNKVESITGKICEKEINK